MAGKQALLDLEGQAELFKKQEQEEMSPNLIPTIISGSLFDMTERISLS